ncbi:uncharacterized protein CANTADRAFT_24699 [Suhomyces tanzawaensis NRRL Y-17324]|uniref:Uncharacterized protein n=1 Tax=Suhomyces tanzawaensis NRRL Y-17324 TaxID=984487 RepID=A0A1E4SRG8_9ASCO|nr:uncharacterized protein CANTADRAFT_24699 [Suhomyces tanzawaensis NRRL Y-17324]ODV82002.1 hypothetical protein CANTADRAFT_24699 [Suhomyces tanzawaensis NRRL Y-17324]
MAVQKDIDLNKPLDASNRPLLSKTQLTPELSQASLNLHGDFYRQLQSKMNRHIFWHPVSCFYLFGIMTAASIYRMWDYIVISDSVVEFFSFFFKSRDFLFQLTTIFPVLIVVVGSLGLVCYMSSDDLKTVTDRLTRISYVEKLYGFNLREFAKISDSEAAIKLSSSNVKLLKNGANSLLMVYRESPIAIVTLSPLIEQSTPEKFIVEITGLHVRKVFGKVDFDALLLDWAILRSRQIYQDYVDAKNIRNIDGNNIRLYINGYTFDQGLTKLLKSKNFIAAQETFELNPFEPLNVNFLQKAIQKVFDIKRITYGLNIITKNGDKDVLLNVARESGFVNTEPVKEASTSSNKNLRKRK